VPGEPKAGISLAGLLERRGIDAAVLALILGIPGVSGYRTIGERLDSLEQRLSSQELQIAVALARRDGADKVGDEKMAAIQRLVDEMQRRLERMERQRAAPAYPSTSTGTGAL